MRTLPPVRPTLRLRTGVFGGLVAGSPAILPSMRRFSAALLLLLFALMTRAAAPDGVEAVLVIVGDQHSAYERTAQVVAQVDRLKAEYPGVPLAVLIDGDVFEQGNGAARARSTSRCSRRWRGGRRPS